MDKGDNLVQCALMNEINHALNMISGERDQKKAFTLVYLAISGDRELRDLIEKKYGREKLNELIEHYRKTTFQQEKERKLKVEAKKIMDEAKQKVVELKAKGYVKQTEVSEQNTELKKQKQKQKQQEREYTIKSLNDEYKQLEAQLTDLVQNGHVWKASHVKNATISYKEDEVRWVISRVYEIQEELGKLGAEVPPKFNVESIAKKLGKTIFDKP